MKRRLILDVILLLLVVTGVSAQSDDKTVESINKRYAEIAEKARLCETDDDQGEYGDLFMNALTINSRGHQWRAVGIYGKTFKFFYKAVENDERRLYPDQLVFVKVEGKESSRTYSEEYLFSEKGVLVLYQRKAENDQSLRDVRVYFSGLKPINIMVDGKAKIRFSASESRGAAEAKRNAAEIKEMFARSMRF